MSEYKQWPEGICDKLTLSCSKCGIHPSFDYTVTDELWDSVVPTEFKRNVICLPCLDLMSDAVGKNVGDYLVRVQFTGLNKTIVLTPESTFIHSDYRS